jgi:hypothetical protein
MEKIEKFTKLEVQKMRKDIDEALAPVAEKYEVLLNIGNISYSDTEFRTKLEAAIPNGLAKTAREVKFVKAWKLHSKLYDLGDVSVGHIFIHLGEEFRIEGWNSKSYKYPVVVTKLSTNQRYKFDVRSVRGCILFSK